MTIRRSLELLDKAVLRNVERGNEVRVISIVQGVMLLSRLGAAEGGAAAKA